MDSKPFIIAYPDNTSSAPKLGARKSEERYKSVRTTLHNAHRNSRQTAMAASHYDVIDIIFIYPSPYSRNHKPASLIVVDGAHKYYRRRRGSRDTYVFLPLSVNLRYVCTLRVVLFEFIWISVSALLHHRRSNHASGKIKTGRPDRIKGGITLLF